MIKTNLSDRGNGGLFSGIALSLFALTAVPGVAHAQTVVTPAPGNSIHLPSSNIPLQPNTIPLQPNTIHLQPNNLPLSNGSPNFQQPNFQQPNFQQPNSRQPVYPPTYQQPAYQPTYRQPGFQPYQQPYYQQPAYQPYPNVSLPQNQLIRPNYLRQNPYPSDYQQPNQFQTPGEGYYPLPQNTLPRAQQPLAPTLRQPYQPVRRQPYTQPQRNSTNGYNYNNNRDTPPAYGALPPSAFDQPQPHQLVKPHAPYPAYFPPNTLSSAFRPYHDINANRYRYHWNSSYVSFGFGGYYPTLVIGETCTSPFGTWYGCPQYISSNCIITTPYVYANGYEVTPVQPFVDTDAYVAADVSRARSLRAALNDLTRAWEENDARALRRRVAPDLSVAVFQQERFAYSLRRADFLALAADAIDHVRTISFHFDDTVERNDGLVNAYATHRYQVRGNDGKSEEKSATVRCTLIYVDGDWYLSAISLAPDTV